MKILSIDTSSEIASCSLLEDKVLLGECVLNANRRHSVVMATLVDNLLRMCETAIDEIDLFACGIGPGSYTGIRIAVSYLNGINAVLKKPMIGVSSLETLAEPFCWYGKKVTVLIYARNDQVYGCVFDKGEKTMPYFAGAIDDFMDEAIDWENSLCIGTGAEKFREKLEKYSKGSVQFAGEGYNSQKTYWLGRRALRMDDTKNILEPLYLRKTQAERMKDGKA